MRQSMIPVLLLLVVLVGSLGCASGPEERPKVSYQKSAKENFLKGKKALEDEDYLEAIEYLKFVKNKFPYSKFATEADLLLADCHYGRDKFIEAVDAYQSFVKLHPQNPKVPYALFRIGLCYYNQIPDDWWFAPPAFELDQTETEKAIQELGAYLKRFPDDENAAEGRKFLDKCLRRLGERVYYLMDFYRKKGKMRATLWRAEELLKNHSGIGFDEEALYRKAEAHSELGEFGQAQAALSQLLEKYPSGGFAAKAKNMLNNLAGKKTELPKSKAP